MSEVPQSTPSLLPPRSHTPLLAVVLFILAVIPFLPALHGEFNWDDQAWLMNNAAVHAWNGLLRIWNPFAQDLHFYPITFTTFWLEDKIWGLNTTGYHLVNMIIQGCNALLLWRILNRLGLRAAWLAALLWAIHPLQVDSVAWIVERKNTLSGLFYFLTALSYLRFARIDETQPLSDDSEPNWFLYAAAILFFILGLLSKTVICTLPAALILILWWKRGTLNRRHIVALSILLVIGLAIAVGTAHQEQWVLTEGGADNLQFNPLERIVIAGRDVWFYLRVLLLPYPLMPIYPRLQYDALSFANVAAPIAVAVVLALLFLLRKRIGRAPLVVFSFFLITLSPALGFINFYTMHFSFVANHYQYLAGIAILAAIAEILFRFARRFLSVTPAGISVAIAILALAPATAFYASLYQTNMKLWKWNVDHNPAAFAAQHNLGIAYMNAKESDLAAKHILIAVNEQPEDDFIQTSYGRICRDRQDYAEAIRHFNIAIHLRPLLGGNYVEVGKTYERMRLPELAILQFATAVAVDGTDPDQHVIYAKALVRAKEPDLAVEQYKIAIPLAPGNLINRYNFGNLLLDLHRYPESIEQYQTILKIQDDNPLIWHNLAAAYYESGQIELALAAKKKANDLDAKIAPSPPPPPLPSTIP